MKPGVVLKAARAADRTVIGLLGVLRVVAGLLVVAVMIITTYDVLMRYFFAAPVEWALTVSVIALLGVTFFAAPHLVATREHVAMDLIYDHLGGVSKRVADAATWISTLAFGLCMAWLGYRAALSAFNSGLRTSGNFSIPQWTFYACIYVGGLGVVLAIALAPFRAARPSPGGETLPRVQEL